MRLKDATYKFLEQRGAPVIRKLRSRGLGRNIQVRATSFIEGTELVPKGWGWFWGTISDNAPFSWGDNNRTLIDAQAFADHCEDRIMDLCENESTTVGARREWLKKVRNLGQLYVDLEN